MAIQRVPIGPWIVVAAVVGCAGDGAAPVMSTSAANPASCEALVDHRIAECPGMIGRLRDIQDCEQNRVEAAPMGCTRPLADYVACETQAAIGCDQDIPAGCEDELMELRLCRQAFTQRTSCSRQVTRDESDCAGTGRFAFSCINLQTLSPERPANCQLIHEPASFCCDSFTDDKLDETLFVDSVLGPDELPPDFSGVDLANTATCLDFSEAQGWGRCEASSGCACASCTAELMACAANYNCLVSHDCDRGGSCGNDHPRDPFFTGWADTDPLVACMERNGCSASCN